MGGVLVGDSEHLKKCWEMIELQDGKFSNNMEQVMQSISEIAMANKCAVVFQQEGDEPSFADLSSTDSMLISRIEATKANLDKLSAELVKAGVFIHVNPLEYYDVDEANSEVVFRVSRFAVGSHPDISTKVNDYISSTYPEECAYTFLGNSGSAASVVLPGNIRVEVLANAGTQDRFLITASLSTKPEVANSLVVDYKDKKTATALFKNIVTADNIFLPRNVARGTMNKVGLPTPDAIMYDCSNEHAASKIELVLHTLFQTETLVRGAVLVSGLEGGLKDKLFLLKAPDLTAEAPALERCWQILKEMYQDDTEGAPEMKKPNMTYFKFRL